MTSPNGPLGCSLVGANLEMTLVIVLRSWSHSVGTWVRSSGITAPSASTGPPLYGGSNWISRDATSVGLRITACASAGTLYLFGEGEGALLFLAPRVGF